ncbi:MAG TPA: SRPBCC domain-containing protein [Micromonosporaceae bacterium]
MTTSEPLVLRVHIDTQPDSVFKALTDADSLADWFADSAEVSLDESRFEFWGRYAPQGDRPRQRLLAAEPPSILRYVWQFDEGESTVEVNLAAAEDATTVTVTHTGMPAAGTANATALRCFWHMSLANLEAHCEGLPTTPPFDFSVPAVDDAIVRTVIDAPVDEVFASLLDPGQVSRWSGGQASIEPSVGGRYDLGWDHGPDRIVELDPDRVLAYSWRHAGEPDTAVRWTLRGSRGSTFLTLIHSGFADDTLAERYRQGWPGVLVELKRMAEQGERWEPILQPRL